MRHCYYYKYWLNIGFKIKVFYETEFINFRHFVFNYLNYILKVKTEPQLTNLDYTQQEYTNDKYPINIYVFVNLIPKRAP